ncbi:hypothetical protein FB157_103596 [Streptomyces sp. BK340]|nr:hypothetical protein FB157_103596 [Streptomyces sp. BK340]
MPSVTVTSTGLVKSAFLAPAAGVTAMVALFVVAVRADAVAPLPSAAAEAPAEELQPARAAAAGTAPRAARIPRRDHPRDRCPDRFDMSETPTTRLPELSVRAWASCAGCLGRPFESVGCSLRFG